MGLLQRVYFPDGTLGRFALAGSILSFAGSAASAETCPPIAVLEGSGAAAQELTATLIDRGVRVEPSGLPPGECGVLRVKLAESDGGFSLSISDPWGRAADRTVKDISTAAALIESWARMDLLTSAQTSTRTRAKISKTPVETAPKEEAPAVNSSAPPEEPPDLRSALLVRAYGEGGVARDRQKWVGAAMSVCARVGFACLGVKGRYSINRDRESNVDALLGLDTPIALGALTLTPGIGFGAGWSNGDENNVSFRPIFGDGDFDDDFEGRRGRRGAVDPRAEARLTASLRLYEALHLELGGSATISPEFGHSGRITGDPEMTILRAHAGLMWGTP